MKHPVPDRVKPLFVIFDIRAFSIVYDNNKVSKTNYNSCQVYITKFMSFFSSSSRTWHWECKMQYTSI